MRWQTVLKLAFNWLVVFIGILVDQGSFAHVNAAQEISRAAFCGKTRLIATEWSGVAGIRTRPELLAAIREFFKDNPAWE